MTQKKNWLYRPLFLIAVLGLARPGAALDDAAWAKIRAEALEAARMERAMPLPLRPGLLRGADLERDGTKFVALGMQLLADANPTSATQGEAVLAYLGDKAADALGQGLRSKNATVRSASARLLSELGNRGVDPLAAAIRDGTVTGHSLLVRQLIATHSPRMAPVLIEALRDPDPQTQIAALRVLGPFHEPKSIAPAADIVMHSMNREAISQSAQALLEIDPAAAQPILTQAAARTDLPDASGGLSKLLARFSGFGSPPNWSRPDAAEGYEIEQLARDAKTYQGERFGDDQIKRLADFVLEKEQPHGGECIDALIHLHAFDAIDRIVANARQSRRPLEFLLRCPTAEAVDYYLDLLQTAGSTGKPVFLSDFGVGAWWVVPVLVGLLDDPALTGPGPLKLWNGYPVTGLTNQAHVGLSAWIGRHGGKVTTIEQEPGADPVFDESQEILTLKKWWKDHQIDFMAGRLVDLPPLHHVIVNIY